MEKQLEAVGNSTDGDAAFDLGTWVGRRQAFGLLASKCSGADADILRKIRDEKLYQSRGLTWEEFCHRHLGMSRPNADLIIRQLEEFGTGYFHLKQTMRISPVTYRAIASAVSEDGITFAGERIPFAPENSHKILQAVEALQKSAGAVEQTAAPHSKVKRVQKRFAAVLEEISGLAERPLDGADHNALAVLLNGGMERLAHCAAIIRTT